MLAHVFGIVQTYRSKDSARSWVVQYHHSMWLRCQIIVPFLPPYFELGNSPVYKNIVRHQLYDSLQRVFVITLYIAGARIDTFLVFENVHRSHIVYATVFWSLAKAIPTHAVLVGWKYHFEAEQARIGGTSREKTRRTATSCCFGGSWPHSGDNAMVVACMP